MRTQLLQCKPRSVASSKGRKPQQLLLKMQGLVPLAPRLAQQLLLLSALQCLHSLLLERASRCCCSHAAKCALQPFAVLAIQQHQAVLYPTAPLLLALPVLLPAYESCSKSSLFCVLLQLQAAASCFCTQPPGEENPPQPPV